MLCAAGLFSAESGFRVQLGHLGLAAMGALSPALGIFLPETVLVSLGRLLILANIIAAVV